MCCWGSWANTQKLADKRWRFELFYWDFVFGVVLLAAVGAFTLGSNGSEGRSFIEDLRQADISNILSALTGGVIFNAGNILLVAAIAIAGMAVAFPVGVGLSLVLGVILNYVATPLGDPVLLFVGVGLITAAIILDSIAYRRVPSQIKGITRKGIILSVAVGFLLAFSYRFTAGSMSTDLVTLERGKLGPYAALFFMSMGLLVSNLLFNTLLMKKPFVGEPVALSEYFKGDMRSHAFGLFGGVIWGIGMLFNLIAAGQAGFPISYGLGQGATMVAAFWGVFIWKEFKDAPNTGTLISLMFLAYIAGLGLIIASRIVDFG
jgi:glucose uptake protein